jgi:hypothetical protein
MDVPRGVGTIITFYMAQFEREFSGLTEDQYGQVLRIITDYLHGTILFPEACTLFSSISSSSPLLDRIREVIEVPEDPVDDFPAASRPRGSQTWTSGEDVRLLAGIYHFGINNWAAIAQFVGHWRTRAQCAQRWKRGLDPRICRLSWDANEDIRLMELVAAYGECSWTKISSLMENRSDVQCRYRHHQLKQNRTEIAPFDTREPPAAASKMRAREPTPERLPPPPYRPVPLMPAMAERRPIVRIYRTPAAFPKPEVDFIVSLLNVH